MNTLELLYKYMAHIQKLEDSTFLELINTPFSSIPFTQEEINVLRELEKAISESRPALFHS